MTSLFGHSNVFFDPASEYKIGEVNERKYLEELLAIVKERLHSAFGEYEFYLFFSHDPSGIPASTKIIHPKKILLWFSDESGAFPHHITEQYLLVFKTYVSVEKENVYSTPLGYVNEFHPQLFTAKPAKDVKVFFSGNLNKKRYELYKMFLLRKYRSLFFLKLWPFAVARFFFSKLHIHDLSMKNNNNVILFSDGFKTGLAYPDYSNYIRRSLYVICPTGFKSNETFRHIEALHNSCIVISRKMPNVPMYRSNPFILYDTPGALLNILKKINRDEFDREALQRSHAEYYHQHLSTAAAAERIYIVCNQQSV